MKEQEVKRAMTDAADGGAPPPELDDVFGHPAITDPPDNESGGETDAIDGGGAPQAVVAEVEQSLEGEESGYNGAESVNGPADGGPCPTDLITGGEEWYHYRGDE